MDFKKFKKNGSPKKHRHKASYSIDGDLTSNSYSYMNRE